GLLHMNFIRADGAFAVAAEGGTLPIGEWSHVVGTFDGTTLEVRVDGDLVASSVPGMIPRRADAPLGIGAIGGTGAFPFVGTSDGAASSDRALSPSRMTAHYLAGRTGAQVPLLGVDYPTRLLTDVPAGYWRLDETDGTTAADSSGYGHHAAFPAGTW